MRWKESQPNKICPDSEVKENLKEERVIHQWMDQVRRGSNKQGVRIVLWIFQVEVISDFGKRSFSGLTKVRA